MSTLRTDTLQTTDSSYSVDVADIASIGSVNQFKADLANVSDPTKGAALVGFNNTNLYQTNTVLLQHVYPELEGYSPSGTLAQRTAALQAAFNKANTNKRTIVLNGYYMVSKILLEDHVEYSIEGTGVIFGVDATVVGPVLEIKNCTAIKSSGNITISGSSLVNYTAGIKVWGSGGTPGNLRTCSLHILNFNVANVIVGWQFGDKAAPDNLLSEIVIYGGYTYNTPQPIIVIGTQAVIEAQGYQLISSGSGAFAASFHCVAAVYGGRLIMSGGEAQIPGVTNGYCFAVAPITSVSFANSYGTIEANGAAVETASLIFIASNPDGVTGIAAGTGGIKLSHCWGFHSFSGASFQDVAGFSGKIIVSSTCDFRAPVARAVATVASLGTPDIQVSDQAFNSNFRKGLFGISGGIPHFDFQQILEVSNLSGQAMPAATSTVLKFNSIASTPINARFTTAYNIASGVFTVPPGGLKSVQVFVMCNVLATRPNSVFNVLVDGAIAAGIFGATNRYVSNVIEVGDLVAGQTISLRFSNQDTLFSFGSVATDRIVFRARN